MSLKVFLTTFFLGTTTAYPAPKGSGPGISVQAAPHHAHDGLLMADYVCTTSEGVQYSAGSSIINTNIHQLAVCSGPNYWARSPYPTDCDNPTQDWCWNNCAHNFGATCSSYCKCSNDQFALGASSTAIRLGAGVTTTALESDGDNAMLGHSSGSNSCPWWLSQAIGQLSPGALGFTCYTPGQLCKYPAYGQNFLCTNLGVWKLQSNPPVPSPTPAPRSCPYWSNIWAGVRCRTNGVLCNYPNHLENYMCTNGQWQLQGNPNPPVPSPTPPPHSHCPSWSNIWNGDHCPNNNVMCNYPDYFENFMCTNGRWRLQGNPPVPSPTPAPQNPVSCPLKSFPPSNNGYCSVDKLLCKYRSGNFRCSNGRWKRQYY